MSFLHKKNKESKRNKYKGNYSFQEKEKKKKKRNKISA